MQGKNTNKKAQAASVQEFLRNKMAENQGWRSPEEQGDLGRDPGTNPRTTQGSGRRSAWRSAAT